MLDQLIIGERGSLDFDASLAKITTNPPKKKSIKETVPFSNVTYDFSAIDGELYWEERTIACEFEIVAPTPNELEEKKTAFLAWIMNVQSENIISPFDPEYHYTDCTYSDMTPNDDEGKDKSTITVNFTAYPYKIANTPKEYAFSILAGGKVSAIIINDSSHKIAPTLITNADITLKLNDTSYSLSAGEITDDNFTMQAGENALEITNTSDTDCNLTVRFFEEVF